MTNKEVKAVLNNLHESMISTANEDKTVDVSEEIEALKIALSKFSSPWTKCEYKPPTKPGRYICAVIPQHENNKIPYIIDIYKYGTPELKNKNSDLNNVFYKWDPSFSVCMFPDVVAWMPVPFYHTDGLNKETE